MDEMCLVCGGPPAGPHPSKFKPGLEWVDKFIGIPESGERIPLGSFNDQRGFDRADGSPGFYTYYQLDMWELPEDYKYGLACHECCYELLQRDLGYTLRFQDAWPLLDEGRDPQSALFNSFSWTSYGGIDKYYDQEFDFEGCYRDGNEWMIQDPLTNEANAQRILQVWRPLLQNGFKKHKASGNGDDASVPRENE